MNAKKDQGSQYAVIQTGGKQYKVHEGDTIDIELLKSDAKSDKGSKVMFDVLLVADGKKVQIGEPTLKDYQVVGELVGESAGPKIDAAVYKRRQGYQRRFGHRQKYSRVKITGITKGAK